jgi:hypothetical protein
VRVTTERPTAVEADGEVLGSAPADFDTLPACWRSSCERTVTTLPTREGARVMVEQSTLAKVRERLERLDVHALVVAPGPDLRYLTGYDALPLERPTLLIVPADRRARHRRSTARASTGRARGSSSRTSRPHLRRAR